MPGKPTGLLRFIRRTCTATFKATTNNKNKHIMKHASKLMAILLVLPIALGLTSCAEVDNSIDRNPLADQVKGMWWTQYDADGTTLHGDDYTRIINSLLLNDDGTGYACTMYFDNESGAAVFMLGGYTLQGGIKFNYTTTDRKSVV